MTEPIRVLIVDDHALFRSGIRLLLQRNPEFAVVGEASDGLEGVKRALELKPDILLMDRHMPGVSGLDAIKLVRQDLPATRIIMLTVSEDADDLTAALQSGACGYLLKTVDADVFLDSLQRAMQGDSVISREMTAKLVASLRKGAEPVVPNHLERLTPREREILVHVAAGLSNKEIARKIDVAENTVKIHLQSILRKLEINNRVQAAIYAVEHGLAHSSA